MLYLICNTFNNILFIKYLEWFIRGIGTEAFNSCYSLASITIPTSVKGIAGYAFFSCSALTNVDFEGTVAQWKAISKNSNWNVSFNNYTIYCTDGMIAKDDTVIYY